MAYTVMVVDDSETIRSVLVRSLGMTKLPIESVITAVNGADALEKLKTAWVDIVFSDIHMPVMDGITLFDTMQKDAELREIPVVIVSTEGSATRIDELKKKGIKGYLRKPFTPEKLRDVIVSTLGEWDG
jgi:two-component system chemotaxis response regulator CheY